MSAAPGRAVNNKPIAKTMKTSIHMGGAKGPPASVRHLCRSLYRSLCRSSDLAHAHAGALAAIRVNRLLPLNPGPSSAIRHWSFPLGLLSAHPLSILSLFGAPPPLFLRPILPGKIDVSALWTMCLVGKRREIEGLGKDASSRTGNGCPSSRRQTCPTATPVRLRPWWSMTEPPAARNKIEL